MKKKIVCPTCAAQRKDTVLAYQVGYSDGVKAALKVIMSRVRVVRGKK